MKSHRSVVYSWMIIVICLICLGSTGKTVIAQMDTSAQDDVQSTGETDAGVPGEYVLEKLKNKIPEEKVGDIEGQLKDKKVTMEQLTAILNGSGISYEEIDAVLSEVRERLKFIETLKNVGPVALSMHEINGEIETHREALKKAESDEVKNDIATKIKSLNDQIKEHEDRLGAMVAGISPEQMEKLPENLKNAGFKESEPETITQYVQAQIEFIRKMETLETIIQSIDKIQKEIAEKERERRVAETDDKKAKIDEELKQMSIRLKRLEHDYTVVITGIDMNTLLEKEKKKVDWEEELKEIFSPIIVELKDITDRPRKMEMLRSEISYYEKRIPQIKQAIDNIEKLKKDVRKASIYQRLEKSEAFWTQQEKEFESKLETAGHQLFELERGKMTLSESFDYFVEKVLKHRGKNILIAFVAFMGTFLLLHLLRMLVMRFNPLKLKARYLFLANFIDVLLYVIAFLAAIMAMVIALYTTGDWLVLGIVIIVLLGLVWAARNTLPQFAEQIKLLLGVGPVRQGERVIIDDIPYRVDSIGIYCYLVNPLLTGGARRLPLKDLIKMRSRPVSDEKEPWFPCRENDYILINGDTFRHVVLQTPEIMHFEMFEMIESMPTDSFINQKITNLSQGPFWVGFSFEIAYKHRYMVLDDICTKLTEFTEAELQQYPWAEHILTLWIDFEDYHPESLALTYAARVKAEAASDFPKIKRSLRKAALKAANHHNLEIVRLSHVAMQMHVRKRKENPGEKK